MDDSTKTLPREPWCGSQVCGWQIAYGLPWDKFCAERKADGLPVCREHWDELFANGESTVFAIGNVAGDPREPLRLMWEPYEGTAPVEPSKEEIAAFAAMFA